MPRRPRIAKIPLTYDTMKSLTNALLDSVTGRYAPIVLRDERIRICDNCPYGGRRCDMCGCSVKVKASLISSSCPLRKWPSASRDTRIDSTQEQNSSE